MVSQISIEDPNRATYAVRCTGLLADLLYDASRSLRTVREGVSDDIACGTQCTNRTSFCEAAYEVGGNKRTLKDAWSGDHMGFYSSLGAVNRTTDPGRRSYAATGYLRPNQHRPNLKCL